MSREVPGQLVEPFARGDDVVGAFEFSFEVLFLVDVADFSFFQFFGDAFVQIINGYAQFVAASVVVEGERGVVFYCALEVVGGDVVAEDAACDLVVFE